MGGTEKSSNYLLKTYWPPEIYLYTDGMVNQYVCLAQDKEVRNIWWYSIDSYEFDSGSHVNQFSHIHIF